jgi:hypothetical protein
MVTIGITGHRDLDNLEQISPGVEDAIRKILDSFPEDDLTIISPLAEGADRLVVWRAMENNDVHLIVPLPLEIDEYMQDFDSLYSKAEFVTLLEQAAQVIELPAEKTRQASYQAAGLYVLEHSDVLIAVWDGAPAKGVGGTAEIVAEARKREMPLAWIQVTRKTTKSSTQREKILVGVHYEHFPDQLDIEAGGS